MRRVMKWLLLPLLLVAVFTVAVPRRAEARVWVDGPGYYAGYRVYRPGYVVAPRAYWYAPYRVYRPGLVVPRVYAPYVAPRYYWSPYWGW